MRMIFTDETRKTVRIEADDGQVYFVPDGSPMLGPTAIKAIRRPDDAPDDWVPVLPGILDPE